MLAAAIVVAVPTDVALGQQPGAPIPPTHTVRRGDTLWDLAARYLGDPFRWPEIYRLNTDVVEDPHWIYPDEVLRLPGAPVLPDPVVALPADPGALPVPQQQTLAFPSQTVFTRPPPPPMVEAGAAVEEAPFPTVRFDQYLAAPWVAPRGGPESPGRIIGSAELPAIESAENRPYAQLRERVLVSPPTGAAAPAGDLYMSYVHGPLFEDIGQVVIPTGIVEIVRPPQNGEAAIARVVRMYGNVQINQRLIPFDSAAMRVTVAPIPVSGGSEGRVRWIQEEPVLPTIQRFMVLTLTSADGVGIGDEVLIYQPRREPVEPGHLATPEIPIGRAQVIRVTPLATTAILLSHEQPKISAGNAVRVVARVR